MAARTYRHDRFYDTDAPSMQGRDGNLVQEIFAG